MVGGLYRRIYAGFITGRRMNTISLEAEAWFWRLHAIADDFGNLPGSPTLVKAFAAPLRDITTEKISELTLELENAKLIIPYYFNEDLYIHIEGFEVRQPAGKNGRRIQRFPMPECQDRETLGNPGESRGIQGNPVQLVPPSTIPKTKTIPTTKPTTTPNGLVGLDGKAEANCKLLEYHCVRHEMALELAALPWLTCDIIDRYAAESRGGENPAGLLVSKIRGGPDVRAKDEEAVAKRTAFVKAESEKMHREIVESDNEVRRSRADGRAKIAALTDEERNRWRAIALDHAPEMFRDRWKDADPRENQALAAVILNLMAGTAASDLGQRIDVNELHLEV